MLTKLEFYVGLLVGGVFAILMFMTGGIAAAPAAVGIPAVVGLVGTIVLSIRGFKARRAPQEAAA